MLDIKFVRENPEIVKQNIKNKFQDSKLPLVDEVIALDFRNREIKQEVEGLRAERNKISDNKPKKKTTTLCGCFLLGLLACFGGLILSERFKILLA